MASSQLQDESSETRALDEYAAWLRTIPWKLYGTFTFAWPVSDAQADKVFYAFINRMERHIGSDIAWVRGDEKRWSGCGMPSIPRHYHAVFWSAAPLSGWLFESEWMSMAGVRASNTASDERQKPGAKVDAYDPNRNAVSYVLKMINSPEGDWQFGRLDLALPASTHGPVTSRQRRRLRRHEERVRTFRETR